MAAGRAFVVVGGHGVSVIQGEGDKLCKLRCSVPNGFFTDVTLWI